MLHVHAFWRDGAQCGRQAIQGRAAFSTVFFVLRLFAFATSEKSRLSYRLTWINAAVPQCAIERIAARWARAAAE
jgi:hypothetical protein